MRRRAIPDARSALLCAARASRLESAAVVVAPRGRTPLFPPPPPPPPCGGARFPTLAAPFCALLAHRAWNPPPSSSLAEEERLCSLLLHAAARDSRRSQRLGWPPVWLRSRAWVIRPHPSCTCFMRSGFSAWLTVLRWPGDLGWIPLSLKNCCSISRPAVGSNA